ncbi:MAG: histidinol-phosphate transaminase [Rhodospirillaceae bacterium]|nr:histidinol-phosphate transaminase [Rhodospirillaceae bacterium]
MLKCRPGIMELAPYVPGKSQVPGNFSPIKLSANESALGPSEKAIEAFYKCSNLLHLYPDGNSIDLRASLGEVNGLNPENIVCGAGSDELLYNLARGYAGPGDEVLISDHAFNVYPIVAYCVGANPVKVPENNLTFDVEATIESVSDKTKIVFIANPNNPTGSYITSDELRRLRAGLREDILLVIDCAYAEFVTNKDYNVGYDLVDGGENTVVTRTFSKIYALAALRIGWCYAPPPIVDVLNRLRGPFNLSTPAQSAGKAAVEDISHMLEAKEHNTVWLPWLRDALTECGLKVYPSVANFLLVQFGDNESNNAQEAMKFFANKGILPRETSGYGLPNCLRVTVGKQKELEKFVGVVEEFLAK